MCLKVKQRPLAVPLAVRQGSDGRSELEYTLALAKAVTKRPGGDHRSSRRADSVTYPIGGWTYDPGFRPGSHRACLHFGTPGAALAGELASYGSHVLISLPSLYLWGDGGRAGRCWHDAATLPIACLACDGLDLEALGQDEFWRDLWRDPRIGRALPAGALVLPSGRSLTTGDHVAAGPLWRRSAVLASDEAVDLPVALAQVLTHSDGLGRFR